MLFFVGRRVADDKMTNLADETVETVECCFCLRDWYFTDKRKHEITQIELYDLAEYINVLQIWLFYFIFIVNIKIYSLLFIFIIHRNCKDFEGIPIEKPSSRKEPTDFSLNGVSRVWPNHLNLCVFFTGYFNYGTYRLAWRMASRAGSWSARLTSRSLSIQNFKWSPPRKNSTSCLAKEYFTFFYHIKLVVATYLKDSS